MPYLLDTNVLITAKRFHYGFDFCPGFWEWIVRQHRAERVFSVERVYQEIKRGNDDLTGWADQMPDSFFLRPTANSQPHFAAVSQWMAATGYSAAQVSGFSNVADFYLVGQALEGGYTLVTYEAFQKQRGKIQIPEVCGGVQVACVPPHEMLRREQARFVLGAGA